MGDKQYKKDGIETSITNNQIDESQDPNIDTHSTPSSAQSRRSSLEKGEIDPHEEKEWKNRIDDLHHHEHRHHHDHEHHHHHSSHPKRQDHSNSSSHEERYYKENRYRHHYPSYENNSIDYNHDYRVRDRNLDYYNNDYPDHHYHRHHHRYDHHEYEPSSSKQNRYDRYPNEYSSRSKKLHASSTQLNSSSFGHIPSTFTRKLDSLDVSNTSINSPPARVSYLKHSHEKFDSDERSLDGVITSLSEEKKPDQLDINGGRFDHPRNSSQEFTNLSYFTKTYPSLYKSPSLSQSSELMTNLQSSAEEQQLSLFHQLPLENNKNVDTTINHIFSSHEEASFPNVDTTHWERILLQDGQNPIYKTGSALNLDALTHIWRQGLYSLKDPRKTPNEMGHHSETGDLSLKNLIPVTYEYTESEEKMGLTPPPKHLMLLGLPSNTSQTMLSFKFEPYLDDIISMDFCRDPVTGYCNGAGQVEFDHWKSSMTVFREWKSGTFVSGSDSSEWKNLIIKLDRNGHKYKTFKAQSSIRQKKVEEKQMIQKKELNMAPKIDKQISKGSVLPVLKAGRLMSVDSDSSTFTHMSLKSLFMNQLQEFLKREILHSVTKKLVFDYVEEKFSLTNFSDVALSDLNLPEEKELDWTFINTIRPRNISARLVEEQEASKTVPSVKEETLYSDHVDELTELDELSSEFEGTDIEEDLPASSLPLKKKRLKEVLVDDRHLTEKDISMKLDTVRAPVKKIVSIERKRKGRTLTSEEDISSPESKTSLIPEEQPPIIIETTGCMRTETYIFMRKLMKSPYFAPLKDKIITYKQDVQKQIDLKWNDAPFTDSGLTRAPPLASYTHSSQPLDPVDRHSQRKKRANQRTLLSSIQMTYGSSSSVSALDSTSANALLLAYKSKAKPLQIHRSSIHSCGLFSLQTIQSGEFVIEYVGEVISIRVSELREKSYHLGLAKNKSGDRLSLDGSSYFFRLDEEYVVDATIYGNKSRFINHSCDPNCTAKIVTFKKTKTSLNQGDEGIALPPEADDDETVGTEKRILIFAKRTILPNEEITYDYKFPIEKTKIPCHCGAKNCRGYLN